MSDYSDAGARRDHTVWDFLNRVLFVLAAFVVVAITVAAFLPKLKTQREHTARLEQLKAEIEKERVQLVAKNREVHLLQHDPGYVEIVARDRMEWMKEGEVVFRVETPAKPDTSHFKRREK